MQKVKNWFIRTFGLRGSFQWALRQMKKGGTVMRANASTAVLFRARQSEALNDEMLIMWKIHNQWNGAGFSIEELESTDWIVVTNKDEKPPIK